MIKTDFNLCDYIIDLLISGKSLFEMTSILGLDANYLTYLLKKIKSDCVCSSDYTKFEIVIKINELFGNQNGRKVLQIGEGKLKSKKNVFDLICLENSDSTIMEELDISPLKYLALLKILYFELFAYGNPEEKKYINIIKYRIDVLDELINYSREYKPSNRILLSSNEDIKILNDCDRLITTNGRFHQIEELTKNDFRFDVISDTHFGSLFENEDYVKEVFEHAKKTGIRDIFHCGDLIEGNYKGYLRCKKEYRDIMAQIEHVINDFCYDEDITIHIILGNHDLRALMSGINIHELLSTRKDFHILGYRSGYLHINGEYIGLKHEVHKIMNNIDDEQVFLSFHGHSHQYRCIYNDRNTIFKSPTLSDMKSNNLCELNRGFLTGSISYDSDSIKELVVDYNNFDTEDKSYKYVRTIKKHD